MSRRTSMGMAAVVLLVGAVTAAATLRGADQQVRSDSAPPAQLPLADDRPPAPTEGQSTTTVRTQSDRAPAESSGEDFLTIPHNPPRSTARQSAPGTPPPSTPPQSHPPTPSSPTPPTASPLVDPGSDTTGSVPATTSSTVGPAAPSTNPTATTPLTSSTTVPSVAGQGHLIGVHIDDVPFQGLSLLENVESAIGRVEIVHWYQAWGAGHAAFRADWLNTVANSGRIGLITWEPWALTGQASQPEFSPAAIVAGNHDAYIRSWAEGFAARNDGPWYLRPMHEMNGNWYPWSGGVAGGDPAIFQAAWRHMHQIFADQGVSNVRWVWCPLVDDISGRFEDYYPGGRFVDVLCLDGYNWGTTDPAFGGWRSPTTVFSAAARRIRALGNQPVWFGEVGSAPEGGDKAQWITDLLVEPFPRLEAVVFFNLNKERDWRVHSDATVAAALRAAR